jgi:hypothetical protein
MSAALLFMPVVVAGWIVVMLSVLTLAFYRVTLIRRDHHIVGLDAGQAHRLHRKLESKEEMTDRRGLALTLAAALYTLAIVLLLAWQAFEGVLHKLASLFAIR